MQQPDQKMGCGQKLLGCGCLTVVGLLAVAIIGTWMSGGFSSHSGTGGSQPAAPSQTAPAAATGAHLTLILRHHKYDENGYFSLDGVLKNDGTQTVFSPIITLTVKDRTGTLVAQQDAYPTGQLLSQMAPGVSAAWDVIVHVTGEPENIRYSLHVSGAPFTYKNEAH